MVDVLGTQLGRYQIRERLGQGGMAVVYKAWDTNLDRWVAIKVLHDHLAGEPALKERFRREAKVVAKLNHPNIVQVYDFGLVEHNGLPVYYMVMPYMPGPSLREVIEHKPACGERFTLDEIDNIMRGVCGALAYAHAQGMIHRDVKPGNILFNDQGQAVLADFGIARLLAAERLTQSGATTGTPLYMPPEQATGQQGDHRSDIYSLGVILYELLEGHPPFISDSVIAIVMKHINDPVPPLNDGDGISAALMGAVLYQALAKDPEDRYQSAAAFLTDFERAAAITTRPSLSEPSTLLVSAPLPVVGRRRVPSLRLAGSVLALGVAVGIFALSRSGMAPAATPTATLAPPTPSVVSSTPADSHASSMTTGPLIFKDDFGPDRGELIWPLTTNDDHVFRNIENGYYLIRHTLPATGLPTIFDEEHQYASGFAYEADFTISDRSQNDTATGIIFRYRNADNYYVFSINGQGQVSIWLRSNGQWTELRQQAVNWTLAEGARPKGQANHLKLIDDGGRFQGYVNGSLAIDVASEPAIKSGAIGIYLATTSSPRVPNPFAEVQVDNFSAAYYVPPTETPTSTPTSTATNTPTPTETSTSTPSRTSTPRPRLATKPIPNNTPVPSSGGSSSGGGGGSSSTSQPQPTQGGGGIIPTLAVPTLKLP